MLFSHLTAAVQWVLLAVVIALVVATTIVLVMIRRQPETQLSRVVAAGANLVGHRRVCSFWRCY